MKGRRRWNTKCSPSDKEAAYALGVLTTINMFNFVDRYVPSSTKDLFKADLKLTDAQSSLPLTAFMVVYMLTNPLFGHLADKGYNRKAILIATIILWSAATSSAFFAWNFPSFLISRTLVGVGEAAYATIAPVLISDFFPPEKRNRALTIFFTAIPVGAALGFVLGGAIGQALGWRYAFLICGAPGILTALAVLRIKDPGRGVFDHPESLTPVSWKDTFISLLHNKMYIFLVVGYILVAFGVGGMADWLPTYLERVDKVSVGAAGIITGAATVIGGLVGTGFGGFLADFLRTKTKQSYFALSGCSLIFASILVVAIMLLKNINLIAPSLVIVQIALWFYNGPMNAALANCAPANIRGRAYSLCNLFLHLLGDSISPLIIGGISDSTGSLEGAIALVPISVFLSGITWTIAWRVLPAGSEMNGKRFEDIDIITDETTMHLEETQNSMGLVTLDEINE